MRSAKMRGAIAAAAFLLAGAAPAAQAKDFFGFVGAAGGVTRVDGDDFGDLDTDDTGWKIVAGSEGRIFGGELTYTDLGSFGDAEVHGYGGALTIGVPLIPIVKPYGKVGYFNATVEAPGFDEDDAAPYYGVGVRISPLPLVGLRLEYERFDIGDEDVDFASLGLEVRF